MAITTQPQNEPDLNRTPNTQKRLREKLERDMKKFLKKGGKVKVVPPGVRSDSEIIPVAGLANSIKQLL